MLFYHARYGTRLDEEGVDHCALPLPQRLQPQLCVVQYAQARHGQRDGCHVIHLSHSGGHGLRGLLGETVARL
jgi:hypothetical protein